jgi:hypothetical protein
MIVIQISEDGEEDEALQEEGVEDEGVVQEAAGDEEETSMATTSSSSNKPVDKPRISKSQEGNLVPLARVRHRKMQQLSLVIPITQVRRQTSELRRLELGYYSLYGKISLTSLV